MRKCERPRLRKYVAPRVPRSPDEQCSVLVESAVLTHPRSAHSQHISAWLIPLVALFTGCINGIRAAEWTTCGKTLWLVWSTMLSLAVHPLPPSKGITLTLGFSLKQSNFRVYRSGVIAPCPLANDVCSISYSAPIPIGSAEPLAVRQYSKHSMSSLVLILQLTGVAEISMLRYRLCWTDSSVLRNRPLGTYRRLKILLTIQTVNT